MMKSKVTKKVTYRQLMEYITVLETQLKNNQAAVYDLSQVLTDYVEFRGKSKGLNAFMRKKHLGSAPQIQTRWSVFCKFCKDSYLQLKIKLDF
jgi:hypothetical protein